MHREAINVLSTFNGMGCIWLALEEAGIPVNKRYSSEVDKYANIVNDTNYPDTIQLGDVSKVKAADLEKIDLLVGGSPCQGFSFAGKQLNFDDDRSALFFEFVRLLEECRKVNPNVKFLLENVRMKKEFQDIITSYMGVEPIEINSSLVSAQNRRRLYWTNIPNIQQPEDEGIYLKDIVHENVDQLMHVENFNINPSGKGMNGFVYSISSEKSKTLTTNKGEGQKIAVPTNTTDVVIQAGPESDNHIKWFKRNADLRLKKKYVALDPDKAITMTARQYANWNGNFVMEELANYLVPLDTTKEIFEKEIDKGKIKFFTKPTSKEKIYYVHNQEVQLCVDGVHNTEGISNYLFGCITPSRVNKRQNGQRFNEGKKFYTLTAQDRHGILTEGYIRKLTPIECERLQTVPDHYTSAVSNSQRYKMLGNGWTVKVISHILKNY